MKTRKGQTSSPIDVEGHYDHHVVPVLADKHVRAWTADDLRKVVRALDARVEAGELKWKTAVNVWATVTGMLADAVRSNDDAVRCRDDNPVSLVEGPQRG